MSKYKFTKDGKKVVVLGDLNEAEKIVQEIFVSVEGQEFPGGDNFIASGLLDQPAKTWRESELEKLEARYERTRKELEERIQNVQFKLNNEHRRLGSELRYLKKIDSDPFNEALDKVRKLLSGKYTHVVAIEYSIPQILTIEEAIYKEETRFSRDGYLKLLTLYGRSNGDFQFNINQYGDGSGGNVEVIFCTSYEDAISKYIEAVGSKSALSEGDLKIAKQHNVQLPESLLDAYNKRRKEQLEYKISKAQSEIEKYQTQLTNL